MRKALITGINGQDGSYLAELLLSQDYDVYGIVNRTRDADDQLVRIAAIRDQLTLFYEDIADAGGVIKIIRGLGPDEIYNLASQSRIDLSFDRPIQTIQVNALGAANVFEAARQYSPYSRI